MDCEAILNEAILNANLAESIAVEKWRGRGDACGFAWVTVYPANCKFVNWCKKQIKLNNATGAFLDNLKYGRKEYGGGWTFWSPGYFNGQEISIKEAGAEAFAEVLRKYGINAISVGLRRPFLTLRNELMQFPNEDETIIAQLDEALVALEAIVGNITSVLKSAKTQLVLLGGDPRGDELGDKVQAAVLDQIDSCLDNLKLD